MNLSKQVNSARKGVKDAKKSGETFRQIFN